MKRSLSLLVLLIAIPAHGVMTGDTDKNIHSCSGSTGPYAYGFKIWNDDDIKVIQTDGSNRDTTLFLSIEYTVSGAGDDTGGSVTLVTACPSGSTLTLIPVLDYTQESDYIDGAPFAASTIENDLDYQVSLVKQTAERTDRAIKFPESCTDCDDIDLERPTADAYLLYNSDGTAIINSTSLTTTVTVPEIDNIDDYANLTAVSAIVGNKEIIVHKSVNVDADSLTIPSNVVLQFTKEGRFVTGIYDITLASCPKAGPHQIFDISGGGSVDFSSGACEKVYTEWWGADSRDVADDLAAMQAALVVNNGAVVVQLLAGVYVIDGTLTVKQDNTLLGAGGTRYTTKILAYDTANSATASIHIVNSGGSSKCANGTTLEAFSLIASDANTQADIGIYYNHACFSTIHEVSVENYYGATGVGIEVDGDGGASGGSSIHVEIENCRMIACTTGVRLTGAAGTVWRATEVTIRNTQVVYDSNTSGSCGTNWVGFDIDSCGWCILEMCTVNSVDRSGEPAACPATPAGSYGFRIHEDGGNGYTNEIILNTIVAERVATGVSVETGVTAVEIYNKVGCCNDDDIIISSGAVGTHYTLSKSYAALPMPNATTAGLWHWDYNIGLRPGFYNGTFPARQTLVENELEGVLMAANYTGGFGADDEDDNPKVLTYWDSSYGCDEDTTDCMIPKQLFSGAVGSFTCSNATTTDVNERGLSGPDDVVYLIPTNKYASALRSDPLCDIADRGAVIGEEGEVLHGHTTLAHTNPAAHVVAAGGASANKDCGVWVSSLTTGTADGVTTPKFTVTHTNLPTLTASYGWALPKFRYIVVNMPNE